MAFYSYLSTKIIIAFITKSYQDLFGVRSYINADENVIKIVEEYGLNSGYNPFEYTLCTSETEDIPDNGVDWDDCTVQEYIDFMRKGIIPQYYEKDYKEWLSSQKED